MDDLSCFHDSILNKIEIIWEKGELILFLNIFENNPKECQIIFKNFNDLIISRNLEWGLSDQINEIKYFECSDKLIEFNIEVQSGDNFIFKCEHFILNKFE
ncbi:hypothetical protein [Pigmentibacter ruber]|uniref:hypothetical protein n=1 Tax=Pigmentibacter ruber TaxID=2683196 RepID=UPI00131A7140|nr:hypothetical protein [Pigmentibacter ruber]